MPQVDRIFGNEGEADVTARIVDTYGHNPGAKYAPENQPGGEGAGESGVQRGGSPGETVAADSIGRQAEQGIRAYVLRRVADASAPGRQSSDRGVGKDTQDLLVAHRHHREAAIQPSQCGALPHPFQPRRQRLPVRRHQHQRRLQILHYRLPHPAHRMHLIRIP